MAGQSAWDLIQPGINSFIQSFDPKNVPVSSGWKDAAKEQNTLRRRLQDYAPGVSRGKPVSSEQSKPAYSGSRKGAMMGVPNDPRYKTEELEQGQKAEDFRKGAGFTGQSPTRDVQKATGSGTQTSPGGGMPALTINEIAQFYQKTGLGGYSGIQLPGTKTNPITGTTIDAAPFSGQTPSVTPNTLGAFSSTQNATMPMLDNTAFNNPEVVKALGGSYSQYAGLSQGSGAFAQQPQQSPSTKGYTELMPSDPMYAEAFGQDLADRNSKGNTSRLNDALNDTAGMQSYMSKFGSPEQDRRRAADMAFLNYEGKGGSMIAQA